MHTPLSLFLSLSLSVSWISLSPRSITAVDKVNVGLWLDARIVFLHEKPLSAEFRYWIMIVIPEARHTDQEFFSWFDEGRFAFH